MEDLGRPIRGWHNTETGS